MKKINKIKIKKILTALILIAFTFIISGTGLTIKYMNDNKEKIRLEKKLEQAIKLIEFSPKDENNVPLVEERIIVYDNMTKEELVEKINKSLNSNLANTGEYFVNAALEHKVDPYLAVAISLHETGCKWTCSTLVRECNNIGGIKGEKTCYGYHYYESLEEGINSFIKNIANNYYAYGYTTAETMQRKYTGYSNSTWASKVNNYINNIKSA